MDMNMDMLTWVVDERFSMRLTLTLLHFLWQGCCVGLVVFFLGLMLKQASARSRYTVNVTAMLLMAACLPVTFWMVGDHVAIADPIAAISSIDGAPGAPSTDEIEMPAEVTNPVVARGETVIPLTPSEGAPDRAPVAATPSATATAAVNSLTIRSFFSALPLFSRWIALVYFAGVAFILGRLLTGIWGGHRLRRMAIAIGDRDLIASYLRLAQRVGLKAAPRIAWCEQVSIPVVVGIVRPMILLPMSLATALAPDQLQALLLHELSHIRRFDPIINLVQRVVEAGLFFHPVVWFVSRRISLERELAADDMVLAAGWARPAYADALVRVAEIAAGLAGPKLLRQAAILGATGKNPSDFKQRVLRLLGESQPPKLDLVRGGAGALLLSVVMGGVLAWSQTERDLPVGKETSEPVLQAPSDGLDFLKEYPQLKELRLDMTEAQFLEIAKNQDLKTKRTSDEEKTNYKIGLGDGHTLIVMFDKNVGKDAKCSGIHRIRGEEDDADRAAEADKEPYDAYMKIMDFAPMSECKAAIQRLDDGGIVKLASQSRERLAKRWKSIAEQPVASFLRELPKKPVGEEVDRGGDLIGVQTELDGVWSSGKGTADRWTDWIERKQQDYRTGRLQLLFEAAQGYRKIDDAASAKRALISGLSGYEIYDADLKTLIEKYWPIASDDAAKSLGSGPHAWTLVNFLDELSAAHQLLGEVDDAIAAQSRLTLAHFMLSWNVPSAGPAQQARRLWSLLRQRPQATPLFWFHVLNESNPKQKFDLSGAGEKGNPLTYHHQNVAAGPSLDFSELVISANTRGRSGILECYRINPAGKHESIGVLKPAAEGDGEQKLTTTLKVPAGTSLVQFLVAGEDFQVGEVTVEAKFSKAAGLVAPAGVKAVLKPAILLPDHWILNAVAFDRDDQEIITVSNQSFATVRRWDVVNQKLISEIKLQGEVHGQRFREGTFVFSGDRKKVIAATDTYVGIWDTASGALLKKIPFPTKSGIYECVINWLDCTPDLSVIAGNWATPSRLTHFYDAHVMIWNGHSGELVTTVVDKGGTDLKSIDLSKDGKLLATTHGGGASLWEVSTGRQLLHVPNINAGRKHPDSEVKQEATHNVWSVQLSPDGEQLAFGDILGVKLVSTRTGALIQQLEGAHRYGLGTLVFSPDGQWLARLGTEDTVEGGKTKDVVPIWSTKTGKRTFDLYTEANDAAFSADGKRVAIGFSDMQQALAIWPLDEGAADVVKPEGPGPGSRVDRVEENGHYLGKVAAEYALRFKPIWNEATRGLEYGIALTKPRSEYRIGERVPLVVFFRNVGDKPVKFDTQPDLYGNPPKVVDAKGAAVALENIPLLGQIPHYHETLKPGEVLGPLYLSFGLGENPRPGKQHWHPLIKAPGVGKYSLRHSIAVNFADSEKGDAKTPAEITSSPIEFEIVEGIKTAAEKPVTNSAVAIPAQPDESLKAAVRGLDLAGVRSLGYWDALKNTPELNVPDPLNPGSWTQPKNVFQMPLGEHTWLKYPAGSGRFYIEHRPDGTWENEVLYGPIEGDPFVLLKLDGHFRDKLKPNAPWSGEPSYRIRLMFRTGDASLMRRAWNYIEELLRQRFERGDRRGLYSQIGLLEIARESLRDEAAALARSDLSDLAAEMREVIASAEAAIDALNDSIPDETYQSATYLQSKIEATLPDALWGEPIDGLRLGLVPFTWKPEIDWYALPADAKLPTSIRIKPGEAVRYQLLVENVSDWEIKFCGYDSSEEMGRSLEVLDASGKPASLNSLFKRIPGHKSYWRLKSRERKLLLMPEIHFYAKSDEASKKGHGYHVAVDNGEYTLRCSVVFGDLDNQRHRHVPGQSEWIGKLTTGAQAITFGDSRSAPDVKK